MAGWQISAGSNWEYLFQNDSGNRFQTLLESFGLTKQFALVEMIPRENPVLRILWEETGCLRHLGM
jgi:hypothetical protein